MPKLQKKPKKLKLFRARAMCVEKSKQKQNSPFQNKKWWDLIISAVLLLATLLGPLVILVFPKVNWKETGG
jgi:hypothetical protein